MCPKVSGTGLMVNDRIEPGFSSGQKETSTVQKADIESPVLGPLTAAYSSRLDTLSNTSQCLCHCVSINRKEYLDHLCMFASPG